MSRKLIVNDGKRQREMLLVGTMVVGRDPACDISDADPLLSRRHVEFVAGARDVVVRDLGSRNGILINGVKMTQGILRGGDVVQVGHLQVTFVEDAEPIAASMASEDADATAMVPPPASRQPAPPPRRADAASLAVPAHTADAPTMRTTVPVPGSAPAMTPADFEKTLPTIRRAGTGPDKTRVVAPPTPSQAAKPPSSTSAAPAPAGEDPDRTRFVPPPTPPARKPVPSPAPGQTAATSEDSDKTRFIPPPLPPSKPAEAPPPRPRPAARPAAVPHAEPAAVQRLTASDDGRATARVARRPWTFFVLLQVALLATVVFLATVIPLILWQQRVLNATASSRASALTNWLATSARAALEAGNPSAIANATDDVSREPGVVSAMVLSPEGRVLAPAARSAETIATLPAIAVKPGEVSILTQSWNGELVESARPVAAGDRPRAAIAWITYRPDRPAEAGSGAVVLAVPVIIVLVATWFTSRLINRKTMSALTVLNEDIELAVGGRLDAIGDPLGAKPVRDLADAVNYLIAKLRSGGDVAERHGATAPRPAQGRSAAPAAVPAAEPPAPVKRPVRLDARIVANAQFRVTEASPGCAELIGVRPDALVGQHLIDAIPDRDIADAVLRSLSALGSSGEHRTVVTAGDRGYGVSIHVSREGKDKPLTIAISADRGPDR